MNTIVIINIILLIIIQYIYGSTEVVRDSRPYMKDKFIFWPEQEDNYITVKEPTSTHFNLVSSGDKVYGDRIYCLHTHTIDQIDDILHLYDTDIESLNIYVNHNSRDNIIQSDFSSTSNNQNNHLTHYFNQFFPSSSQDSASSTLYIGVSYRPNSDNVKMESYSTVKQLSFNSSVQLAGVLKPIIGIDIMPLNSRSSIPPLVHMGMVPNGLDSPTFENAEFDQSQLATDRKSRFLQTPVPSNFRLEGWFDFLSSIGTGEHDNFATFAKLPYTSMRISKDYRHSHTKLLGTEINIYRNKENNDIKVEFRELFVISGQQYIKFSTSNNKALQVPTEVQTVYLKHQLMGLGSDSYVVEKYTLGENYKKHTDETITDQIKKKSTSPVDSVGWKALIVDRKVKKQGFHRDLETSLILSRNGASPQDDTQKSESTILDSYCQILILEHMDEGIFVDRYEVDEIHRFGGPQVNIYQLIDLEKPSYTSTQNYITTVSRIEKVGEMINITLPIHLRYQHPSRTISRSANISPPILFSKCDNQPWSRVDITSQTSSLEIEVPVGQLDVRGSIGFFTLLVTIFGSLVVITTIYIRNTKPIVNYSKNK